MGVVIGVDVGTSGTKAVAIDASGRLLASALAEYPLASPQPGWAEQDPKDWLRAAYEVLATLAAAPEVPTNEIAAIGLTGQMHGSVFLDEADRVLHNAILWCDQRTAAQCAEITAKVGEARLMKMVCNPALTGFTAPKILWLREHEPAVYERVRKVLLPKDYVRLALTGEYATDVADASGTLLFDVKNRTWHRELLSILEIDPGFMPPAYEGPEVTGYLTQEAATRTGLPKGIPVIAGGGDQAAGGVGCGIVQPGVLSATVGTSGVVFAFAKDISMDPQGRVHTFCHSVPGAWHTMGVVLSAGGSLRWYRDALCGAEVEAAKLTGRDPYEFITEGAAQVAPGAEGLVFLPYLTGERTPHKDPFARGAFIGLSLRHTRQHLGRAVLEGVAFAMRDSLEIMRGMGVPIEHVRASGGGARSPLWRQIQADVYNLPLETINVDEGPAFGAAVLAAVGMGLHASVEAACAAMIRVVDVCEPDPAHVKAYDDWYGIYRESYPALAGHFNRTASLL